MQGQPIVHLDWQRSHKQNWLADERGLTRWLRNDRWDSQTPEINMISGRQNAAKEL